MNITPRACDRILAFVVGESDDHVRRDRRRRTIFIPYIITQKAFKLFSNRDRVLGGYCVGDVSVG